MSTLSTSETTTSLHASGNQTILKSKKINKIKKTLLNFAKEEITSFNSLKVKIYKEEIEDEKEKNENKIIIPETFKHYFEDNKRYKKIINKIESGIFTSSIINGSAKAEQVDSSDLVNSE